MEDLERLSETEALAMAGLLRMMIREDGRFTDEEREALSMIASAVTISDGTATSDAAYRGDTKPGEPLGEERLYALIERAGEEFMNDDEIRAAALGVVRIEARETIHALLFEVAASDMISKGETSLLDWLAKSWSIEPPKEVE